MHRHLGMQRMPEQTPGAVIKSNARLVAGSLYAQHQHRASIACGMRAIGHANSVDCGASASIECRQSRDAADAGGAAGDCGRDSTPQKGLTVDALCGGSRLVII